MTLKVRYPLLLIICQCLSFGTVTGQSKPYYFSSGGEVIFSFARIKDNGKSENSLLRFAPVFNPQVMLHRDKNKKFGFFSGVNIHNTGYVYDKFFTRDTIHSLYKKKFRSYNLGIPIGIKFGDLDNMFFFAGYELELPFHYKEKTFNGDEKIDKYTSWFSRKEKAFQHGFLLGMQTKSGVSIKFKYYLSEFHNPNYTDGNGIKVYNGLKSHIFYFSVGTYFDMGKKNDKD